MLFVFILWISLESSSPIHGQTCSSKDSCRQLEFRPDHTFDGKRLKNHLIRTVDVMDGDFCETVCYMEPNCVSYNLKKKASENGKYKCELNNSTFEGQKAKLEKNSEYIYRGAKNACVKKPCKNNATCQTGFTDKGYHCLCTAGFKGEHCTKVSSCKEIYDKKISIESKAYPLVVGSLPINVYCHMNMANTGNGACGDGGWKLVMKINGTKPSFHYDSSLWRDKETFNIAGGETAFDTKETKLPTYWNTPFSKICLGMKIGEQLNFVVIDKEANSLHSLIADGQYRATSLGRNKWKKLIGSQASLQYPGCNKEGFNAESGDKQYSKARIGFLGNNENDCSSCDSRIGFGTGGAHDNSNTCGNYACCGGDNGWRNIKAMGYIFVQ